MISGNENRETAEAIMCLFFKLNFNQRSKFFRDLGDNPLLDKLTDYIDKWYQMDWNNNYIRECFELIHQILSNDQYKGAYKMSFFSSAESNEMLNLQDKFIKFLGVYSDTVSDLLDQILQLLCRCFITEEKEIEVFLPAEPQKINEQEIMEDKDAANTIMFLFFQLDCAEREYFLNGLNQREYFIFNATKYFFGLIHESLKSEDYQGSYHWAEYENEQKIRLKKIIDLFVDYFCKNEGNDHLDQIIFELAGAVRMRWDQVRDISCSFP